MIPKKPINFQAKYTKIAQTSLSVKQRAFRTRTSPSHVARTILIAGNKGYGKQGKESSMDDSDAGMQSVNEAEYANYPLSCNSVTATEVLRHSMG